MNEDLKKIKKYYGEEMMKFCRSSFSTILEESGVLSSIITKRFFPNKSLYNDLDKSAQTSDFKSFIYSQFFSDKEQKEKESKVQVEKHPCELMDEAGYELFECKTEEDIQSFRKYFKKDEELCTFRTNRLEDCSVFFAIKKNVENIKREDFPNPERQDEYGTSVISIQFTKDDSKTLSIKNRYNHTVPDPDATFSNNLDNIIPDLADSFANIGFDQKNLFNFNLPNYVKASDGKFYKYNYEINNKYYCNNNIYIDNFKPKQLKKEKYILLDYFVIDLVDKRIRMIDKEFKDSFVTSTNEAIEGLIKKHGEENLRIETVKNKTGKSISIFAKDVDEKLIIELDGENRIIKVDNPFLENIGVGYLTYNTKLKHFEASNVKYIDDIFLNYNKELIEFNAPKLIKIGDNFLTSNLKLGIFNAPNLENVGSEFLRNNDKLTEIILPNLLYVGDNFLNRNEGINYLFAPKLKHTGFNFLKQNTELTEIDLPELIIAGDSFIAANYSINRVNFPSLITASNYFLNNNRNITVFDAPKLAKVGFDFMPANSCLEKINIPKLLLAGDRFLASNRSITMFNAPELKKVGHYFLDKNELLRILSAPNLDETGVSFMSNCKSLIYIDAPKLPEENLEKLIDQNRLLRETGYSPIFRDEFKSKCRNT